MSKTFIYVATPNHGKEKSPESPKRPEATKRLKYDA